jgi:hypothetical protein
VLGGVGRVAGRPGEGWGWVTEELDLIFRRDCWFWESSACSGVGRAGEDILAVVASGLKLGLFLLEYIGFFLSNVRLFSTGGG